MTPSPMSIVFSMLFLRRWRSEELGVRGEELLTPSEQSSGPLKTGGQSLDFLFEMGFVGMVGTMSLSMTTSMS